MKSIVRIIVFFFISFFWFCIQPNAGFAQESIADSNLSEQWLVVPEDWEHDSALYRGWGWGLFGTGLGLAVTGTALLIVDAKESCHEYDCNDGYFLTGLGAGFAALGGLMLIPGISLLIADAVKFNKYRDLVLSGNSETAIKIAPELDWKHQSNLYRGWGWGLLGAGVVSLAVGTGLMISDSSDDSKVVTGIFLAPIGAAMIIPGVSLLIADAVKFNKYRDDATGFSWQPNFYVSPQMTGFGVSARF
ncbi:MAG: hypothetical protein J6A01_01350 [Proteobacteria bacterium]|nr:hypothetical protein [Pseudomonadota bacterium]